VPTEPIKHEPHKQPPHKRTLGLGAEVWTKTCPSCGAEVLTVIHEFKDGKVVRTFCHLCQRRMAWIWCDELASSGDIGGDGPPTAQA